MTAYFQQYFAQRKQKIRVEKNQSVTYSKDRGN